VQHQTGSQAVGTGGNNGTFQYSFGDIPGAVTGIGNTTINDAAINAYQPGGNANLNANFNPNLGLNTNFNGNAGLNTSMIDPARSAVGSINPSQAYMQNMQDAFYKQGASRLDPRMQQEQEALETQLQNQGLTRGSQAWNAEMQRQMQARNDAYNSLTNSAILNSGAEAQRMMGMDISRGQFMNQAGQQDYLNRLNSQAAFNQANQQNWQNQFAAQGAGNQALAQQGEFGQNAQVLGNAANQQGWQNQFNAGQTGFQNQLASQAAQNQARGQQFSQGLMQGQFSNAAQQQAFDQAMQRAGLNNQTLAQNAQLQAMREGAFGQQQMAGMGMNSIANRDQLERDRFGWQQTLDRFGMGNTTSNSDWNRYLQSIQLGGPTIGPGQNPGGGGGFSTPGAAPGGNYLAAGLPNYAAGQNQANQWGQLGGSILNAGNSFGWW
jgi:hypothetical protein